VNRKSSSSSTVSAAAATAVSQPTEEQIYESAQKARIEWLRKNGYSTHRENGKPPSTAPPEEQERYRIGQRRLLIHGREKRRKSKQEQREEQAHEAWLRKMEEAKKHEVEVLREAVRQEARENKNKKKKTTNTK